MFVPESDVIALDKRFDSTRLKPGVYSAVSNTEAYPLLQAMISLGSAKLLGERYADRHRKAIIVRIGRGGAERENPWRSNPAEGDASGRAVKMKTPHGYYLSTVLKEYYNWQERWFREAIQNSVDARAHEIAIISKRQADGTWFVSVEDDGRGMTEEVIENVFLTKGGTLKPDDGESIGGFGKAKELLILPWISWRLISRSTQADGVGEDAVLRTVPTRKGTLLEVVMPADQHAEPAQAEAFLSRCYLPHVRVTINGTTFGTDARPGKRISSIGDKAVLYFQKHPKSEDWRSSYLNVRAKGVWMFRRSLSHEVHGNVTLELTKSSRDLLTVNRDGFRDEELSDAVDAFANEVAADTLSALKAKSTLTRKKFIGTGKFTAVGEAELMTKIGAIPATKKKDLELNDKAVTVIETLIEELSKPEERTPAEYIGAPIGKAIGAMFESKFLGPTHIEAAVKQAVWQPDFYHANDIEGFRIPKKFEPAHMTATVLRLSKVWTELCRYVLILLGSRAEYGVGFIFSETTGAACLSEDGQQWLMLNPFRDVKTRDSLYRPTDDEDLSQLFASAIHECTHLVDGISAHNEAFSSALTANVAKCSQGWKKVKRIASSIKLRGQMPEDEGDRGKRPVGRSGERASPEEVWKELLIEDARREATTRAKVKYPALTAEQTEWNDAVDMQDADGIRRLETASAEVLQQFKQALKRYGERNDLGDLLAYPGRILSGPKDHPALLWDQTYEEVNSQFANTFTSWIDAYIKDRQRK